LLQTLPDVPERIQQELALQLTLGPALVATKGWAAPEVGAAYNRVRDLCPHTGETSSLFTALFGLWLFYAVREELQPLRELGEQLLRFAGNGQDPARLLAAHVALGYEAYLLGEFVPAREHAEQGSALYDLERYRTLTLFYGGADPGVYSLSLAAWSLWMLGYPDQALKQIHEALTLGQELAHPFSLAFALCFATGSRLNRDFLSFWRGGPSSRGGYYPGRDRGRKALHRSARDWPPTRPLERTHGGRIIWRCWPRGMVV
jgi:predicted ATPase